MATSPLVPGRLPVAIEDHPYQIEPSGFRRETVPVLRQQADQSSEPGEASLNPQGLWRRSQESWHHGAGQDFLDGKSEEAADPHRFRTSKGVDVWTRGQVSLLRPTLKVLSSANSNLHLAVVQQAVTNIFHLAVADGTEVYYNTLPFPGIADYLVQTGTGWTAVGATLSASAAGWISVNATDVVAPVVTSGSIIPVNTGRAYQMYVVSDQVSGAAKIPQIRTHWYTSAGALISSSGWAIAAGNDTTPRAVGQAVTAPATAVWAALEVSWTTSWITGDDHDFFATLSPVDAIGTIAGADIWTPAGINAGEAAQTVQSLATDGINLWAALGTSGLHRSIPGTPMLGVAPTSTANVPAAPAGGQISLVGYANGFLLAAGSAGVSTTRQNALWLVADPLGTPTLGVAPAFDPIKTHPNTGFVWTGIAGGRSVVYAFGNCGGNGEIYKITYDPNTSNLSTAASPATMLPDGETIHALYFYAGGVILGTGKGLRLGQADGAGNIDYGPLIETDWPVRCLEPQDRYCWFGWTKYDATNSGLGRVDLGYFTDTLTPAWASDLMTSDTSTGDTLSCVTFAPYGYAAAQRPPLRVFTVTGEGVYIEDPGSRVAAGQLATGTIRYSTSEPKMARSADVRHHALPASSTVSATLLRDDNPALSLFLGGSSGTDSYGVTLLAGDSTGEAFELSFNLQRPDDGGADYTRTPELTRWTLKSLPLPGTIDETFTIPIVLAREVTDSNDANYPMDVDAEITYLKGLERSRALVNLQLGDEQHTVYVLASEFQGKNWGPGRDFVEGLYVIQCQTVRG